MSADDHDVIVTDDRDRGVGAPQRTTKAQQRHSWRQQAREELEDLADLYKVPGDLLKGARF